MLPARESQQRNIRGSWLSRLRIFPSSWGPRKLPPAFGDLQTRDATHIISPLHRERIRRRRSWPLSQQARQTGNGKPAHDNFSDNELYRLDNTLPMPLPQPEKAANTRLASDPALGAQLYEILDGQRSAARSIEQLLGTLELSLHLRGRLGQIVSTLDNNNNSLEAVVASVLTTPVALSIFQPSNESPADLDVSGSAEALPRASSAVPQSQSTSLECTSEGIPVLLQDYYDAAGWVGVLQERLVDLQYDHYEALERKHLEATLSSLHETQSEREFSEAENNLRKELREARHMAVSLLQQCRDLNIDIIHSPRPSIFHSSHASRSPRSPSLQLDGLPDERRPPYHTVTPPEPFELPRPSITRWLSGILPRRRSFSRYVLHPDPPNDNVSMASISSFPEWVRVDIGPADVVDKAFDSPAREPDLEQAHHRWDMPARRKLARSRRAHSDTSI